MACEIMYNNFEISLACGIYAKYHYKSCYYLNKSWAIFREYLISRFLGIFLECLGIFRFREY